MDSKIRKVLEMITVGTLGDMSLSYKADIKKWNIGFTVIAPRKKDCYYVWMNEDLGKTLDYIIGTAQNRLKEPLE